MDRRLFMLGAGSLFLSSLNALGEDLVLGSETIFASCVKKSDGSFGAVLLDENYKLIKDIILPQRGHDIVFDRLGEIAVIFSRRPGNIATILATQNNAKPIIITAPEGRHFYGHGVFSWTNKLLFASENDYENGVGKIGIYDATDKFNRIGEFDSFGIGPHEIIILSDGITLAVANGGIETHPEFGRAKLNLATMRSSISFINTQDGRLIEQHVLPENVQKLSIRHMVSNDEKSVVFGGQYQGSANKVVALMGNCIMGEGLKFWNLEPKLVKQFSNYTGSLAISDDLQTVAVSSTKGGIVGVFEAANGRLKNKILKPRINGLAPLAQSFIASSEESTLVDLKTGNSKRHFDFSFDNHMVTI